MINKSFKSIDFKDLLYVILYTLVLSIPLGFVLAFIDYYLQISISFTFSDLLYLIIAMYIGRTIRNIVKEPHIIYTIIAAVGMVISWLIIILLPDVYAFGLSLGNPYIIFDIRYYLYNGIIILNPVHWITDFSLSYLISLLVLVVGLYLGISRTVR
jgi:hypothetical protein